MTELQTTLSDLINDEFCMVNEDGNDVYFALPLSTYFDKKENKDKVKGSKNSLTKEQFIELLDTGKVVGAGYNGADWKPACEMKDAERIEIKLRHTNRIVMIDIDGSFGGKGDITMEQVWDIKGLPEWFKKCPYTLSRNKQLPHFMFRLSVDLNKLSNTYENCFSLFNGDLLVNHSWEKPDAVVYNYNGIPEIGWDELKKLFNPACNEGKKLLNVFKEPLKKIEKKVKIVNKDDTDCESVSNASVKSENKLNVIGEINSLFDKIIDYDESYFDDHKTYISLAYVLYNETEGNKQGLELLKTLSSTLLQHEYNNEFNINRFWFQAKTKGDKKISLKKMRQWCEELTGEQQVSQDKLKYLECNVIKSQEYLNAKTRFEIEHFKVNSPLAYIGITSDLGLSFYKRCDMISYCIDKYPTFKVIGGMGLINKAFFELWEKDPEKRQYNEIEFNPKYDGVQYTGEPTYKIDKNGDKIFNKYNLFYGFNHDNIGKCDEETSKFLQLLKYVCVTEEIYEYMKCWFATIIQKPYKKTNVGVVFFSEKGGVGKNAIIDGACKLFEGYDAHIEDIEDITKKFNAHLCNKLFVYGDEITARAKAVADKLKGVITRPTCNMEKKGFDIIPLKDYINWMFTTNNQTAFKIEKDDRRMMMIRCIEIPKSTAYYTEYYNEINDPTEISKLYNFLKGYNCEKYSDIGKGRVPQTEFKLELETENAPAYIRFIFSKVGKLAGMKYTTTGLKNIIDDYAKKNFLQTSYSMTKLGTELHRILQPYRTTSNGSVVYNFINKSSNEIRKHLVSIDEKYYRYINGFTSTEQIIYCETDECDLDIGY